MHFGADKLLETPVVKDSKKKVTSISEADEGKDLGSTELVKPSFEGKVVTLDFQVGN